MTTPTQYFSWFSFLFVCGIALLLSCSDNGGPDQRTMEITRISPDSGAVGTRITVYSNDIDPEHAKNQVEINGTPVPIISYYSNKLIVEVPEGISSGQVTLEVNSKVANGPYFKVLTEGPLIEQVTPGRGGAGTPVTITGNHFLPPSAMAKVSGDSTEGMAEAGDSLQAEAPEVTLKAGPQPSTSINGLPVSVSFGQTLAPLLSLSNTEIIAEVPEGAASGVITLTVDGQTATYEAFRLILPPVISEVTPTAGPVGTTVTITGSYFSPHPDSNQVTFNGIGAAITEADTARLVATVPDGATTGAVEITTGGQTATGPLFTITEAPVPQVTITDISPKTGPVGTTVTITGENFSATAVENTVTFNGTEATVSSASKTELVASVPENATSGLVKVQVNDQTATGPSFSVTVDPDKQLTIEDISPKEGPVGTSVSITGQNFSATAADNTVTFNGTEATVQSASKTELAVSVPADATTGAVKVAVGSQTAEGPTFTVTENHAPTITSNASFEIEEQTTEVGTITATDPEGDALTYSLAGGADQGLFSIGENSGALTFTTAPDFENPGDTDGDNIYEVQVQASDGMLTHSQALTVEVTAVSEQQAFFLAANLVTIRCPEAKIGQKGLVGGQAYTKRSRDQITLANAATTCTSGITDMSGLFEGVTSFNSNISHWDVSSVKDMNSMFNGATSFNRDLNEWDVSGVTDINSMFRNATSFNGDLSGWDVSAVTDMSSMFFEAISFNSNISGWDVSKVTNMSSMFQGAIAFNSDLSGWDVSSVTNMRFMFRDASSFNGDLSGWDVSSVTNMRFMFSDAAAFNSDLSGWDVSGVTNMSGMFGVASSFNQDISHWDVSNVTDMSAMFTSAISFNQDIGGWDVSSVTNMNSMFRNATSFNGDLSGWDVSGVTNMSGMFALASSFNSNISHWDVSSVTNMNSMFYGATSFNGNLSGWCVTTITSEPTNFDTGAGFEGDAGKMPVWGTCPSP